MIAPGGERIEMDVLQVFDMRDDICHLRPGVGAVRTKQEQYRRFPGRNAGGI